MTTGYEQPGDPAFEGGAAYERYCDDMEALRKALYELVYVSFPPVGADVPELVEAHNKAIRRACELLGIDPNGLRAPPRS